MRRGRLLGPAGLLVASLGWPVPPAGAAEVTAPTGSAPAAAKTADPTDLPLELIGQIPVESVSTASRFTQKTTEAPASVSVITADDFKQLSYRTLAEALRGVRGLYVTDDRSYSYLGVRGFNRPGDYNSRVLVLVDGHRMNENVFESAYVGREFILDVDLIDRVEVVRGPSSSLYGSSAFFGVINVITKKAADVATAEASFEVGSFDTYEGRFSAGGLIPSSDVSVLVSGSYYDSMGQKHLYFPEFDAPDSNQGYADHADGETAGNLLAKINWKELTLSAAYVSRQKYIPTATWGVLFDDSRYNAVDEHGYVDLKYEHAFNEETELTARAYFDDVRYTADYPYFPPTKMQSGFNHDRALGQMIGFEGLLTHHWKIHTLTFGTEVRDHLRQDVSNYNLDPPHDDDIDEQHHGYDLGVYAQDELSLRSNVKLNAGVRYDYYDTFGGTVNPRVGLIYNPWTPTTFKLLYGTAFRAPNVYELYFPLGSLPPNSQLDPEKIRTYEAVWEQSLLPSLRLSVSGYYYHIDDLITLDPYTLVFENSEQVEAKGLETELEWMHASGARVRASYALQHAEDAGTGVGLINSPQHLAKLDTRVPLWRDRLFAGFELQYTSEVTTWAGSATPVADDFWLASFTLFSQRIVKGLEVSASIHNLFDARYAYPGGAGMLDRNSLYTETLVYQNGRSFQLKFTYRF